MSDNDKNDELQKSIIKQCKIYCKNAKIEDEKLFGYAAFYDNKNGIGCSCLFQQQIFTKFTQQTKTRSNFGTFGTMNLIIKDLNK